MSEFPHKAFDNWVTQTPEDYFGYEDIEEDETDAMTICPVCKRKILLKNLKSHKANIHKGGK